MKKRACFAALALAVLLLPASLVAQTATSSATTPVPHGNVTMLAEASAIQPHSDLWLAFHFTLEPGWHLYWTNPGDSGQAPSLTWRLPAGLTAGAIYWPVPKRLSLPGGLMDFGYTDDVVLLAPLQSAADLTAGTAANLGVDIRLVICRELCIPGRAQLSLSLPVRTSLAGAMAPSTPQTAKLFAAARSRLPKPAPAAWKIRAQETKDEFLLDIETGRSVSRGSFFPLEEEEIENAAPQTVQVKAKGFQLKLRKSEHLAHPVKSLRGVLVTDEGAYELNAPVVPAAKNPAVKPPSGKIS